MITTAIVYEDSRPPKRPSSHGATCAGRRTNGSLGGGPFVDALRREVAQAGPAWPRAPALAARPPLLAAVATRWGLPPAAVTGGARRRPIPTARAVVCTLACMHLGLPAATGARALGLSLPAVLQAVPRGQPLLAGEVQALPAWRPTLRARGHPQPARAPWPEGSSLVFLATPRKHDDTGRNLTKLAASPILVSLRWRAVIKSVL